LKAGEISCKTIMGRSGIEGVEYSINPYLGCQHGCVYCYARFMTRFNHEGEEWGSFVDAKVNALERLREEAAKKRRGVVLLSSVTDPYQPLERRYGLTRGCLEILLEHEYPVDVLTKSDLVLRDLDLLREFDQCEVGLTITSLDDGVRRAFEPGASPVPARLEALKALSGAGVETYAFLGPLLPYLSEERLEELLDVLADRVNRVLVDDLHIKSGNQRGIRRALREHYPDVRPLFESALSRGSGYYDALRRRVAEMCRERAISAEILF